MDGKEVFVEEYLGLVLEGLQTTWHVLRQLHSTDIQDYTVEKGRVLIQACGEYPKFFS